MQPCTTPLKFCSQGHTFKVSEDALMLKCRLDATYQDGVHKEGAIMAQTEEHNCEGRVHIYMFKLFARPNSLYFRHWFFLLVGHLTVYYCERLLRHFSGDWCKRAKTYKYSRRQCPQAWYLEWNRWKILFRALEDSGHWKFIFILWFFWIWSLGMVEHLPAVCSKG